MEKLQLICKKTRYFWSLSRIFIIVCFGISYSQAFIGNTTFFAEIFMALIFVPTILSMIFIQINGFTKSQKITKLIMIFKIFVSIFTTLFALLLIYVLFFQDTATSPWMLIISLWMLLFAIYELITSQKTEETDFTKEIDQIGQETEK